MINLTSKEKRKVAKLRSSHAEDVLYHTSGSARVFGYTCQGLFKSGIRYIAVKRRVLGLSLSLNFRTQ